MTQPTIGFIGQGYVGKNTADNFEERGFSVVRYSLEEPYVYNKEAIKDCDIVFIAVPTPSLPGKGADDHLVREVIALTGIGKIVAIRSTIPIGTTRSIQEMYPDRIVLHIPEFLTEATAIQDVAHPSRNIIGMPESTDSHSTAAQTILSILPESPIVLVCSSEESELIKYASNSFFVFKILFANIFFDIAKEYGCNWENISTGIGSDPRIGKSHLDVLHASMSGRKPGRGAGGHCLPKDFLALRTMYEKLPGVNQKDLEVLKALEQKNIELLKKSGKDIDILESIYG